MRSGVIILGFFLSSGGCGFSSPPGESSDMPGMDGGTCTSFATQVDTCLLTFDGDLALSGTITYDTGTHELKVNGTAMPVPNMTLTTKAGSVDAIFAQNIRLMAGTNLRATGSLPFAIIASGSVTLEDGAEIDVSDGGAGALQVCSSPPEPGSDNSEGAGGGGGAGYAAAGGDGGPGNKDGTLAPGGAKSGSISMPEVPLGGCPGAHGGAGDSPGGAGGLGGGALYIAAVDRIDLLGESGTVLTAGGGGGRGGIQGGGGPTKGAGGGGGGSGGMIFLEAPHVFGPHGWVAANGGGGGGGSSDQKSGLDGNPGSLMTSRASGGPGGASAAADGGRGGSLQVPTGETVTALLNAGGGGGGGGVGYIHIVSADVQLESVSPAAQ